jgi:hypothetical protein
MPKLSLPSDGAHSTSARRSSRRAVVEQHRRDLRLRRADHRQRRGNVVA